ncbi:MAG: site-2 protease family protein [Gammaproteobacteria bacterium]
MIQETLQRFLIWALPLLFAITIHEVAHGWVALKFGDRTAQMLGRLTLNPLKHIDLIGTVIVPAMLFFLGGFIFGWAKPVPITWENLKNQKRDMALVSLAGPIANLLMAIIWAFVAKLGEFLLPESYSFGLALSYMGQAGIIINMMLMILNLLPIPPLDGSRVVSSLLPGRLAYKYNLLAPFGIFILLGLIFLGVLSRIIAPLLYLSYGFFINVFHLTPVS